MRERHSPRADNYVSSRRKEAPMEATWFEVARAFDAGMASALHEPASARRALEQAEERQLAEVGLCSQSGKEATR